jgi:hypothetical protein
MSDLEIIIQVTIFDTTTNEITKQIIDHYGSSYGYEIERHFERLGTKVAKIIDPHHDEA